MYQAVFQPTSLLVCLAALAACSDPAPGVDAGPQLDPDLDTIQLHIFDQACNTRGCHGAGSMAGGLDLSTADASHLALVDVPAVNSVAAESRWLLVKPGDPELSFLVRKIRGPGLGEGGPMPFDMQLTPLYQTLIEDWISAGALR